MGVTESVAWLEGGIARWMTLGFPVRELVVPAIPVIENAQPSGRGHAGMIPADESARM